MRKNRKKKKSSKDMSFKVLEVKLPAKEEMTYVKYKKSAEKRGYTFELSRNQFSLHRW